MADYTEQRIDLVINRINQSKYDELKLAGEISDTELYIIVDHDDLFYYKTELYTRDELEERFTNISQLIDEKASKTEVEALEQTLIQKIDQKDENLETRLSTVENTTIPGLRAEVNSNKNNISANATNLENYKKTVSNTYAKKTDVESTYLPITTHNSAVTNLEGLITTETTERKQAIQDLKYDLETADTNLGARIDGINTNIPLIDTRLTTVETKLITLNGDETKEGSVEYKITQSIGVDDASGIRKRIKSNEDAITLLNSDENIKGSVKNTVNNAITSVINGAPQAFDTLKEISDWITNEDAEDLQTITGITTGISNLTTDLNNYKTEVSQTYETIENVNSLEASIDQKIQNYKTEVSETYATKQELSEYSPVGANPGLIGDEDILESIQIDGTNYQVFPDGNIEFSEDVSTDENAMTLRSITVGSDVWNLGGISEDDAGSDVVANPELAGNEEVLESLSVDGTNYSIGRDDVKFSTDTINGGYNLKSITVGDTAWNIPSGGTTDLTGYATEEYTDNAVSALETKIFGDGVPDGALDTIYELSEAFKENDSIVESVNNAIGNKQDTLVSGTNIKTINGESILGTGNIEISNSGSSSSGGEYIIEQLYSGSYGLHTGPTTVTADNALIYWINVYDNQSYVSSNMTYNCPAGMTATMHGINMTATSSSIKISTTNTTNTILREVFCMRKSN